MTNKYKIKDKLETNQYFKDFIVGQVLGDRSLTINGNEVSFRLCMKDKEYVQSIWKYFYNLNIVGAPIREYSYFDKRTNISYVTYNLATFTLPYFTNLFKEWYRK